MGGSEGRPHGFGPLARQAACGSEFQPGAAHPGDSTRPLRQPAPILRELSGKRRAYSNSFLPRLKIHCGQPRHIESQSDTASPRASIADIAPDSFCELTSGACAQETYCTPSPRRFARQATDAPQGSRAGLNTFSRKLMTQIKPPEPGNTRILVPPANDSRTPQP